MSTDGNYIVLSICLCGRNDNYGHDFKRRFKLAMDFLAWSAEKAGVLDQLEVVFCDWNSDSPLHEVMQLTPAAAKIVRFVIVPPDIAKLHNSPSSPMNTCAAFNTAARRSKGRFVTTGPCDILYTRWTIEALIKVLNGTLSVPFDVRNSVMLVPRKLLDADSCEAAYFDTPETTEALLSNAMSYILHPFELTPGSNAGSAMYIFPKELFEKVYGNDESFWGWGYSDNDIALRVSAVSKVYSLEAFGVMGCDFLPDSKMKREKNLRCHSPRRNVHNGIPSGNTEEWGLGNCLLPEGTAGITDSFGAMPAEKNFPEYPLTQSVRNVLLERFPSVFVENGPKFSAFTMASAALQVRFSPRKIAMLGVPDFNICASFSLADQYSQITIADVSEENLYRLSALFKYMNKRGFGYRMYHHGHVHLYCDVPDSPATFGTFDLLLAAERIIPDDNIASYLNPGGIILSTCEIQNLPLPHITVRGVHVYTERKLPEVSLLHREWLPADGNIFAPLLRKMTSPCRLLALFARLPLREWGMAFRIGKNYMGRLV